MADDSQEESTTLPILKLTLADALYLALENNLDLEIEELSTEQAQFDAVGSWGAFDPVFSATTRYIDRELQGVSSLSGAAVIDEDNIEVDTSLSVPFVWGGSLDLTLNHSNDRTNNAFSVFETSTTDVLTAALTQPILQGAGLRYATTTQRQSEITYERQREREKEVRYNLILDIYNAYWDLVSAIDAFGVATEAVSLAEEQLQQDEKRLEVGTGTEVDKLQSETNLAQQIELRINAEFAVRSAEDNLRRMLFQRPQGDVQEFLDGWEWTIDPLTPLPDVDKSQSLDWRRSLERAVQLRPELWGRRIDIDLAEVQLERAHSDKLPQLDAVLSTTSVGFDADASDALQTATEWEFPDNRAALTFSMPILNRTARYAERAARSSLRAARLSYDRQELDILAEVRAAVRDVRYRAESVDAAKLSADLADKQLKAEQARQSIGLSTTFQVLEFQQDLTQAQADLVADRAAYAKALAKLAHAEGRIEVRRPEGSAEGGDE